MNRIDFPRRNIYNVLYTKDQLEDWYVSELSGEIKTRLDNNVHPNNDRWVSSSFGRELLNAFNYEGYRQNKLSELAAWLNVKTCPYCNMSYTLYSEKVKPKRKRVCYTDRIARFQFDHFLSKQSFPMLSMSLYNLIPCCPVCNQGKSYRDLPWLFHPYISDIQTLFAFEVKKPLPGFFGARFIDYVPVKLKWSPSVCQNDADSFEDIFHLSVLYSRHGDVVQEVYDKAYLKPYYSEIDNFRFLGLPSEDYRKRLWFDDYMTAGEIHKRPLSKFKQDVLAHRPVENALLFLPCGIQSW